MSGTLDIAISGLRAAELGLSITAHNVANVNVDGYTRQMPMFGTRVGLFTSGVSSLGGVAMEGVKRVSDRFVSQHIRQEYTEQGYYSALYQKLSEVEAVFNQADDMGIANAMNVLFSTMEELTLAPESLGLRITTVQAAGMLGDRVRATWNQLNTLDRENRLEMDYQTKQVNALLEDVARLNSQVTSGRAAGSNVSDLVDDRERRLTEISKMIGARVFVDAGDNLATVTIDGVGLVMAGTAQQIGLDGSGFYVVSDGARLNVENGRLGALLEFRDDVLPDYHQKLEDFTLMVRDEFNAIHSVGYALDGTTGRPMFTGTSARDFAVFDNLRGNPRLFAASNEGYTGTGEPGNAANVRRLLDLRGKPVLAGETFQEYFQSMIGAMGSETAAAEVQTKALGSLLDQLISRRDSVHGVSLDEEMTKLMEFQQAYNASARIIQVVDENMKRLIDRL